MMESREHTALKAYLEFYFTNSVKDLVKRGLKNLAYLFLPEETIERPRGRQNKTIGFEASKTGSTLKMVFWVVVSIILSLAIGQLK